MKTNIYTFTPSIEELQNWVFSLLLPIVFLTALTSASLTAQEICGNGIDDDGDNLIDCADPDCSGETDCSDTFTCSSDLFQVTSGILKVLDPSTGTYTTIGGTTATTYNGTGYNVEDGYIYGTGSGTTLVRINNLGEITTVGAISNFTGITYSGDFDLSGNWLSFTTVGSNWVMGSLDVDVLPLEMTSHNVTDISTTVNASKCADISYNSVTSKYYGCNNGIVVEFDPINKTVRGLANFSAVTNGGGGCGAAWSDIEGNTYFFQNSTGNIYRAQFDASGEVSSFAFIAVSEPNGNNDGMSCPLSSPPVFPEICANGIDDDGDGLVDCDDPDCSLSSDCGEICNNGIDDDGDGYTDEDDSQCSVGSGFGGGLESNRRLSSLISQRNYKRTLNPKAKFTEVSSTKASGTLNSLIPANLLNEATMLDTSPSDLIDVTNATDIFSTDLMMGNRRMASVLAIETENEVYEHTKYICDRLDGAVINNLKPITIGGQVFSASEILQASGNIEYAISFTAFKNANNNFEIESHWNLDKYSAADNMYSFQIWANDLATLETISDKILNQINEVATIANISISATPATYVSTGRYENGALHLRVINTNRATQFNFEGSYTKTETGEVATFNKTINTYGNAVENLVVNVGSIYDIGFRVSNNKSEGVDDLFFADGAWGVDIDETTTNLNSFEVYENANTNINGKQYLVHRNVAISANTTEAVALYRSFTPKFRSKNFNAYNQINFMVDGEGEVEITLVKESINNWNEQYRTTLNLQNESNNYEVAIAALKSTAGENTMSLEDVTMVVLKFKPTSGSNELNIVLEDMIFNYNENASVNTPDEIAEITGNLKNSYCYPNPATKQTVLNFNTNTDLAYTFTLTNNVGRTVKTFKANMQKGANNIDIDLSSFNSGMYYYSVTTNTADNWKGKLMVID